MIHKKTNSLTIVAMFLGIITVVAILNRLIFTIWVVPITPTILQVPVVIASILLGPRLGGIVGAWWGIMSMTIATVVPSPTSYLFSPFIAQDPTNGSGDIRALIVAILPRILVGVLPYFIYKLFEKNQQTQKVGFAMSGAFGSLVNTFFVLGAIALFFSSNQNMALFLASIVSANSIVEMILSAVLVLLITPTLLKRVKK